MLNLSANKKKSSADTRAFGIFLAISFFSLTGCSQKTFAPDPKLQEQNTASANTPTVNNPNNISNNNEVQLPSDFPQEIPIYQTAKLLRVEPSKDSTPTRIITRVIWESSDPSNLIESFYQQQLSQNDWQVDRPFESDNNLDKNTLTAQKDNLQINVAVTNSGGTTQLSIDYSNSTTTAIEPTPTVNPSINPSSSPTPNPDNNNNPSFEDIAQLPEINRQYIQDLANLNVFASTSGKFEPNKPITRREYAKWLLTANNKIYANNPSKQIRTATNASQPVFSDVKSNDADFAIIQGLAESGIIPSSLSGDSNKQLFKPDAPLTREDLIAWKVPLDIRKSLSTASLDNLKETWGFQDVNKISPEVWQSLLADYQNGDRSNLKRTFGFTTLFQPKKTVTKAEAAATLWYFGDKSDGMSAKDAVQIENGM